jgi:RNA polymerase sigma-70 factor (ECF subfamily)
MTRGIRASIDDAGTFSTSPHLSQDWEETLVPSSSAYAISQATTDADLVARAQAGEREAFSPLMQRHNRRLYRVARAVLGDEAEAEDVVQEGYLRAFSHLKDFRGEASVETWLTRIVLNEALGRLRRRRKMVDLSVLDVGGERSRILMFPGVERSADPESDAARAQIRRLLERAVDDLPPAFRTVFVMRDVEGMSMEETATHLGIRAETVKTRLHRARRLLRSALEGQFAATLQDTFPFDGARCARMSDQVMRRLTGETAS